ncbi:MAG: L-threonylcarbamoyladenylate synthase [Coriobacteriia bacterium]|nr:L-threonylcarbamoyladenylate synthase [Coriobacteriia bacterium]
MPPSDFESVVSALVDGRPVVLPTDTLYGIGVSPLHAASPSVLYEIKGRPSNKPVAWLVASKRDLDIYGADVPEYARKLVEAHWPGALTVIVNASDAVPGAFQSESGTIGLRMPDDELTCAIAHAVGCPLAVTSANLSGNPNPHRFQDIDPAVLAQVAAAIDDEQKKTGIGSTVVDCTGTSPRVLRQGTVAI